MGKIIFGLIAVGIGFLITWKAEWILQNFGANAWAERHLGSSGGTRLLYKLIGLGIIVIGILIITGLIKGLLLWVFGGLFRFG